MKRIRSQCCAMRYGGEMTTIYTPPPTPDEIMRATATWVARLYGLKITVTIDGPAGNTSTMIIDRRDAPVGVKEQSL